MRSEADEVQTRSFQWLLVRSMAVALVALLVAALAPVSPAKATNHVPWNQPGSQWQGTITVVRDMHTKPPDFDSYQTTAADEQGSFTELVPVGSDGNAQGMYSGHVGGSGTAYIYNYCGATGTYIQDSTVHWAVDQDYRTLEGVARNLFSLVTDESGATTYTPYGFLAPATQTDSCWGPHTYEREWGALYGAWSAHAAQKALVDDDPDPLHLVGRTVWTEADLEATPHIDDYEYRLTYDLHLVTQQCDSNVTHDIYRAGVGIPDRLEFELRTMWCTYPDGRITITDASVQALTLNSPWEAVFEGIFKEITSFHDVWRPNKVTKNLGTGIATVIGTGKWDHCLGIPLVAGKVRALAKVVKWMANKAPAGKVKWAADKVAALAKKAASLVGFAGRRVIKKALRAVELFVQQLPRRLQKKLTVALVAGVVDYSITRDWAKDYLRDTIRDVALGRLLGDEVKCWAGWKPRIEHVLAADGTSTGSFVNLDGDYDGWEIVRSGGSEITP